MEITFKKDDRTRTVYTPADAVQLRADGWIEVVPEPVVEEPVEAVIEADDDKADD